MCDANAYCNNTKGGYNCTCHPGYYGDGTNCELGKLADVLITFVFVVKVRRLRFNNNKNHNNMTRKQSCFSLV